MPRYSTALIGGIVSVAAVYALARNLSLSQVAHAVAGTNKSLILVGIVALGCGYGIRSFRWWLMLRVGSRSISLATAARVLMAGFAANNVLPLRAGDAFRVFGFRSALSLSSSFVLATLAFERLLDAISLLILAVGFIKIGGVTAVSAHALSIITALAVLGIALFAACLIFVIPFRRCLLFLVESFIRQPERRDRIALAITNVLSLFEAIGPFQALHFLALSITHWAFEGLLYICVALAFPLHVSLVWPCMALLAANLASILPSSPGYVGTFHASIVAMLLLAGVTRNSATAYAVIVHGVIWIAITFAGGAAYLQLHRKAVPNPTGAIV